MKTGNQIAEIFTDRVHNQGAVQTQMRAVRDAYNGDLVLPLPEIDKSEKPAIANLVAQGIDQMGQRFGSRRPQMFNHAVRAGDAAQERADLRRAVMRGYWENWDLELQQYQRGRWWFGYGSYVSTLLPNPKGQFPIMKSWNPLDCYPAPRSENWDLVPTDCLFTAQQSYQWLRMKYPEQAASLASLAQKKGQSVAEDTMFTVVTYIDDTEIVMVVVSAHPRMTHPDWIDGFPGMGNMAAGSPDQGFVLRRVEHGLGVTPITHPNRITLDRITGQFDEIIGMYETQAKLQALNLHGVVRSIFPETWIVSNGAQQARVSQEPDPARGVPGKVANGSVTTVQINPGLLTNSAIDRLERNARVTAGVPAEFGGEAASNVRTDRRGLTVLDSTISFKLAEAQTVNQRAIRIENMLAAAIDQKFHNTRKVIPVHGFGNRGKVEYTPSELFGEGNDHRVEYKYVGTDAAQLTIRLAQKVGAKMMPKRQAMELDPDIDDVDAAMDQMTVEQLIDAQLQGLSARAAAGEIPEVDLARITQLVLSDQMELQDAVIQVQQEAQERQAAQLPAGDPGLQPGLAAVGAGAESAPIPEGPRGVGNLRSQLFDLVQSAQLGQRI